MRYSFVFFLSLFIPFGDAFCDEGPLSIEHIDFKSDIIAVKTPKNRSYNKFFTTDINGHKCFLPTIKSDSDLTFLSIKDCFVEKKIAIETEGPLLSILASLEEPILKVADEKTPSPVIEQKTYQFDLFWKALSYERSRLIAKLENTTLSGNYETSQENLKMLPLNFKLDIRLETMGLMLESIYDSSKQGGIFSPYFRSKNIDWGLRFSYLLDYESSISTMASSQKNEGTKTEEFDVGLFARKVAEGTSSRLEIQLTTWYQKGLLKNTEKKVTLADFLGELELGYYFRLNPQMYLGSLVNFSYGIGNIKIEDTP